MLAAALCGSICNGIYHIIAENLGSLMFHVLGRHLDLDHATSELGERKEQTLGRELSLQMKLDYFEDEDVSV